MSEQASNIPTLEPVWLLEATYVANAVEARAPFRAAHLSRIREMREQGVLLEAGAYADASASLLMFRAATEEDALNVGRADPYWENGIWVDLKARAFNRVP